MYTLCVWVHVCVMYCGRGTWCLNGWQTNDWLTGCIQHVRQPGEQCLESLEVEPHHMSTEKAGMPSSSNVMSRRVFMGVKTVCFKLLSSVIWYKLKRSLKALLCSLGLLYSYSCCRHCNSLLPVSPALLPSPLLFAFSPASAWVKNGAHFPDSLCECADYKWLMNYRWTLTQINLPDVPGLYGSYLKV